MGLTPFDRTVPVIGESFKVVTGFATAVIQCQCEAKTVLVLHGTAQMEICPRCHRAFAIAKSGTLVVGEVVPPVDGPEEQH